MDCRTPPLEPPPGSPVARTRPGAESPSPHARGAVAARARASPRAPKAVVRFASRSRPLRFSSLPYRLPESIDDTDVWQLDLEPRTLVIPTRAMSSFPGASQIDASSRTANTRCISGGSRGSSSHRSPWGDRGDKRGTENEHAPADPHRASFGSSSSISNVDSHVRAGLRAAASTRAAPAFPARKPAWGALVTRLTPALPRRRQV